MKSTLSATFIRSAVALALVMIVSACPIIIRTRNLNPGFARAGVCPEAVTVFNAPSEVGKTYVEVAELVPPPGGADLHPTRKDVVRAQRKKAASLGANGLILQRGIRRPGGLYDNAVAVFIPEDSAHALSACSAPHRTVP